MTDWIKKWQRSPRQDRRVIVDGKFVELTEAIEPTIEVEEEDNEGIIETGSTNGDVPAGEIQRGIDKPVVSNWRHNRGDGSGASSAIVAASDTQVQETGVSNVVENPTQPVENTTVLPPVVEKPVSPDVLAGPVRRTGFNRPCNVEGGIAEGITEDDVDKAFTFPSVDKANEKENQ